MESTAACFIKLDRLKHLVIFKQTLRNKMVLRLSEFTGG